MATEIKLPQLGQTMEEGTVVTTLVNVGDKIDKGQVIFEIETDKATLEMEAPAAGFVKAITVQAGQTIPVGDVMLVLGEENEQVTVQTAKKTQPADEQKATPAQAPVTTSAPKTELPANINPVKLPQLGQTMEEGTIVSCLVNVGDVITKGQVIFEIETDKATLEMESPAAGSVKAVLVETGQTVPVAQTLMLVGPADIELTDQMIDAAKGSALAQPTQQQPQIKQEPITSAPNVKTPVAGTKIIASPRAKKLAKTLALDISTISGTGPAGRIIEKDVKAADKNASAAAPKGDIKLGQRIPMTKMQKITGQRMLESKRDIPCFYLTAKADMTELVHYRAAVNLKAETKVAFNDFIIKAVAMALEKFPIMTGQLEGDNIRTVDTINVGLAMAVDDGLIVPVIKNIENKNIIQVAADSKTLITKAKTNKLKLTDLEEGSFTVSNLGAFGIDSFIPIVVPGQCCIMGVGQIADSCVPLKGGIMIRKIMSMTISVDHRVANGAYAAQFLDYIRKILENPENFK